MEQQAHQEIYRVAYESAKAELVDLSEAFEKLRARMGQIERLVAALKPLVFEDQSEAVESPTPETMAEPPVAEPAATAEKEPETARIGSDPFQHRVSHVLGIGAGIRDVRSYTRQF